MDSEQRGIPVPCCSMYIYVTSLSLSSELCFYVAMSCPEEAVSFIVKSDLICFSFTLRYSVSTGSGGTNNNEKMLMYNLTLGLILCTAFVLFTKELACTFWGEAA